MRTCLVVVLAIVVSSGCKSSSQTPNDGGRADTAADHLVGPETNPGSDGGGARDARDGADAPPVCTGPNCPVVLATDTDPTCCVVVDGTNVYWVHFAGSSWSIMRVPGAGGTPEYFERSEFSVGDMAIKDGALYWTADDGVYRRDLAAARGSATKIVDSSSARGPIAVDGNSVYWSGVSGDPIRKVPRAGGTASDVVTGTDALYVASDGTNVYWSDFDMQGGAFVMAPVGGGTSMVLATDLTNPGDIALDATNVYFANSSTLFGTKFWKVPQGGGTPVMVALAPDFAVYEIAVDATDIYWAAYSTIGKAPIAGGSVTTVATGQKGALSIAVDATNVYWLNTDAGTLMKLAK